MVGGLMKRVFGIFVSPVYANACGFAAAATTVAAPAQSQERRCKASALSRSDPDEREQAVVSKVTCPPHPNPLPAGERERAECLTSMPDTGQRRLSWPCGRARQRPTTGRRRAAARDCLR